jgi:hypothetical protein
VSRKARPPSFYIFHFPFSILLGGGTPPGKPAAFRGRAGRRSQSRISAKGAIYGKNFVTKILPCGGVFLI